MSDEEGENYKMSTGEACNYAIRNLDPSEDVEEAKLLIGEVKMAANAPYRFTLESLAKDIESTN